MASNKPNIRAQDEAEQLLVCQICARSLLENTPRALQCLHTFCQECLERCVKPQWRRGPKKIECPTCRQQTQLPREGIKGLPKNFIVSQTNQLVRSLGCTSLCRKCLRKGEVVEATARCLNCETCFCDVCCTLHNDFPGFRSHNVKAIAVAGVNDNICNDHRRHFECYCKRCNKLLCTECLLDGEHDSHKGAVDSIQSATDEFMVKLSALESQLKAHIKDLTAGIDERVKASNLKQQLKTNISEAARYLKEMVEETEQRLILDLDRHIPDVSSQIKEYQEFILKKQQALTSVQSSQQLKGSKFLNHVSRSLKSGQDVLDSKTVEGFVSPNVQFVSTLASPLLGQLVLHNEASNDMNVSFKAREVNPSKGINKDTLQYQRGRGLNKPVMKTFLPRGSSLPIKCPRKIIGLTDGTAVIADKSFSRLLRINRNGKVLCTYSAKYMKDLKIQSVWARRDHIMFCFDHGGIFEVSSTKRTTLGCPIVCQKWTYPIDCAENTHIACDTEGNIIVTKPFVKKLNPNGDEMWSLEKWVPEYITTEYISGADYHFACAGHRVGVLDKEGNYIKLFTLTKGGIAAATTIGPAGTLLVADRGRHTISEYELNGRYCRDILSDGDIRDPTGIFYDKYNQILWVTECEQVTTESSYASVKVFSY